MSCSYYVALLTATMGDTLDRIISWGKGTGRVLENHKEQDV